MRVQCANNPSIVTLDAQTTELVEDEGIPFIVMLLAKLSKKPTGPSSPSPIYKDPFLPPFEEGLFIAELSETHTLLFNKFQVCKEHVLVVTTKFERQDSPLDRADLEAVVKTMLSLDAFMYFNQGPHSGASQPHKHMQLIPFASLVGKTLPVEQTALKQYETDRCRMFRVSQFKSFEHVVGMLDFGQATFE